MTYYDDLSPYEYFENELPGVNAIEEILCQIYPA
jgi:hypothetical protein